MTNTVKHIITLGSGWAFIVLGVLGLFLPVLQGILFLLIGLLILSKEYSWAGRIYGKLKHRHPGVYGKFRRENRVSEKENREDRNQKNE